MMGIQKTARLISGIAPLVVLALGLLSQLAHAAEPFRLAIVAEDKSLASAAELLTVTFSTNTQIALLERVQIDRVLAEQSLSAANGRDALKLGQLLGADGLLLLEIVREGTNQFLTSRLLAVKPGVVVDAARVSWPVPDLMQWSGWMGMRLDHLFPKLGVLEKDAIPISVVNLRSALRSREAEELERQLTLLTIERLSRERQMFVLERRQMQLLSAEKELKGMDESAFWNGSYLLEGTVDRDGFNPETLTVSARLVPPKGGAPVDIETSGSRTNLAEVISRLTAKVMEGLKLAPLAPWDPADEARLFFEEARWALNWKMIPEAQAAAESAWALGKHDMDCASVRVKAYVEQVPPGMENLQSATIWTSSGPRAVLNPTDLGRLLAGHSLELDQAPAPIGIDRALRALGLYYEFSRTLPPDEPKAASPWYRLGIEALIAGSHVLQHFYAVPQSQKPVADKLAELRALARVVAAWISKSPSVRDTYWVGDRVATHDELVHTIEQGLNIFLCKANFGCFWQETPRDCLALYRDLMSSPVFCYLHTDLWFRELQRPRLTAWAAEDAKRAPALWRDFLQELNSSTNFLLRMEASALRLADAEGEPEARTAFDALFDTIFSNRDALVTNNVEVLYMEWGLGNLMGRTGAESQGKYSAEYRPRLQAMDGKYWNITIPERESRARFERQKQYLLHDTPYDFAQFAQLFRFHQTTKAQASELLPLLATYKSNLVAQAERKTGNDKAQIRGAISFVGAIETQAQLILKPPEPAAQSVSAGKANPEPAPASKPTAPGEIRSWRSEPAANVLQVKQFFKIPVERLKAERISELTIIAHRWREGRLWLDLRYGDSAPNGGFLGFRAAAAGWDPQSNHWDIIQYPDRDARKEGAPLGALGETGGGSYSELFDGFFYLSEREAIQKFDFATRRWDTLQSPGQKLAQLFAIHGRLFAANNEDIIEILDGRRGTRVLASCRRRPAVSALDSLEGLEAPTLFEGPYQSIRVTIGRNIYSWDGRDWSKLLDFPFRIRATARADGTILRSDYQNHTHLWLLPYGQTNAQLCLDETTYAPGVAVFGQSKVPPAKWKKTDDLSLTRGAVEVSGTNLYVFVAYSREARTTAEHWTLEEKNGRHANLVFLDQEFFRPFVVPVKFDLAQSPFTDTPRRGLAVMVQPWWIDLTSEYLLIGKGNAPGLWAIPRRDIDAALALEMRSSREEHSRLVAALAERQKALLTKYDRNKDGILDPEEKTEAIADPDFIELELATIDLNQNGRLAADELTYFDLNKNGILESREQAGIETAQRLLAANLLKKFDADADSRLGRSEFAAMVADLSDTPFPGPNEFSFFDFNRDGKLDLQELTTYFQQQTWKDLRTRIRPTTPFNPLLRFGENSRGVFKSEVEAYWKSLVTHANRPPLAGKPLGPAAAAPGSDHAPSTP